MSSSTAMAPGFGSTQMKNPAPHRGFNSKAREVLLDPAIPKIGSITRSGSDEEFLRKISALKQLSRRDSEQTNGSRKSSFSGPASSDGPDFDGLDPLPVINKAVDNPKLMLGDIGKTRSAGDLFKGGTKKIQVNKTFQQMNIMKLPSVDSDIGANSRCRSLAGFDSFAVAVCEEDRQTTYKVN